MKNSTLQSLVAGVDEVGRGPLAGDVVAAAVILDVNAPIEGLTDSKKLSEKKREALFDTIIEQSVAWAIGRANVAEIDQLNILHASMLAMQRAVLALSPQPHHVLVDGNRVPDIPHSADAIVKGDLTEPCISAASILAKVTRDREMVALDQQYPGYGFAQHKGYPTKLHLSKLAELGVTPQHRLSYAPVQRVLEQRT